MIKIVAGAIVPVTALLCIFAILLGKTEASLILGIPTVLSTFILIK